MTVLQLINVSFTWIGLVSIIVLLGVYSTQGWWRTSIGRFIVIMKTCLLLLYIRGALVTILHPVTVRSDLLSTIITVAVGLIMLYGAFAFVTTIYNVEHTDRKPK